MPLQKQFIISLYDGDLSTKELRLWVRVWNMVWNRLPGVLLRINDDGISSRGLAEVKKRFCDEVTSARFNQQVVKYILMKDNPGEVFNAGVVIDFTWALNSVNQYIAIQLNDGMISDMKKLQKIKFVFSVLKFKLRKSDFG